MGGGGGGAQPQDILGVKVKKPGGKFFKLFIAVYFKFKILFVVIMSPRYSYVDYRRMLSYL